MNTKTRYFYTLSWFETNNVFSVEADSKEEAYKLAVRRCEAWGVLDEPIYHSEEVI